MDDEQKIFAIIRDLYEYWNGDIVGIIRTLNRDVVGICESEDFLKGILEIYEKHGQNIESVSRLIRNVRNSVVSGGLMTEDIVVACINQIPLSKYTRTERYMQRLDDHDFRKTRGCYGDDIKEHLLRDLISDVKKLLMYINEMDKDELTEEGRSVREFLLSVNVDEFLERVVRDGFFQIESKLLRELVTYEFLMYWISLNQIKKWLNEKKLSVQDLIKLADEKLSYTVEDYKKDADRRRAGAPQLEDEKTGTPQLEEGKTEIPQSGDDEKNAPNYNVSVFMRSAREFKLKSKVQNLVVKLLEYYIPREELLARNDCKDVIEVVESALSIGGYDSLNGAEAEMVKQMYKECRLTPEEVMAYYCGCNGTPYNLIKAVSLGITLEEELAEENKPDTGSLIDADKKFVSCIKKIYGGASQKVDMTRLNDMEKNALNVRREFQPLGADVEFKIQKLVVKLLDYYIPREEELLASRGTVDMIDLTRVALEDGWKEMQDSEAQAVQQMYEECDLCRSELLTFITNNSGGYTIGIIRAASRGISLKEFFDDRKNFGNELYEVRWQQWRACVKAIYSGKTEMPDVEGCEDIFHQVSEMRKAMLRSGVIKEKEEVITPEGAAYSLVPRVSKYKVDDAQRAGLNPGQNPEPPLKE